MPTGTLCAERNAIGNALAADQSVQRGDMQAVAVLSVSLDPSANTRVESTEVHGRTAAPLPRPSLCAPPSAPLPLRPSLCALCHPAQPAHRRPPADGGGGQQPSRSLWGVHGMAEEDRRGQPRLQGAHVHVHKLREGLHDADWRLRMSFPGARARGVGVHACNLCPKSVLLCLDSRPFLDSAPSRYSSRPLAAVVQSLRVRASVVTIVPDFLYRHVSTDHTSPQPHPRAHAIAHQLQACGNLEYRTRSSCRHSGWRVLQCHV